MNWLKEIKRIDLDFMDVDHHSMDAHYKIGTVYFRVHIDWWKNNYDYETCRYDIDINVKSGVWFTDDLEGEHVMEFGPGYKEWMMSMLDCMMDEYEFLSEYTWGNDNDEIDWEEYGI